MIPTTPCPPEWQVDLVHFPQSGMISLIVEMPEDRVIEVGTVGSEGAIGLTVGLGSRISSVSALVQVSGMALCIPAQRSWARAVFGRRRSCWHQTHLVCMKRSELFCSDSGEDKGFTGPSPSNQGHASVGSARGRAALLA
jgi:hypothetical protein